MVNLRRLQASISLSATIIALAAGQFVAADELDPLDPFDARSVFDTTEKDPTEQESERIQDEAKSAAELFAEATVLLSGERPLDARTKLLRALQKDPSFYKAHMALASYYTSFVGHFRLALKYVRRSEELFMDQNGRPPYESFETKSEHAQILYLLSQIRLNLDDYTGSLKTLDEYESYGYYSGWYAGTRAWVLMKLGKLDDAIRVARVGALSGAEPGRTLNMLGILLSMKGEREQSLQVFKEAISYELALGEMGQPATPLNNSGEVYNEVFRESMAEASWLRATSMPDGCEHVLPSLNLTLLYLGQNKIADAKKTMDSFQSCIAQYPLRNGEEHKALVHLARGRIALLSGNPQEAITHFEEAIENRQWFGKIGTNVEDLMAGALISLSQALIRENNRLAFVVPETIEERLTLLYRRGVNATRAWWIMRRARQVVTEELEWFEDLTIRNTDSMIEYFSLGEMLSSFPYSVFDRRLAVEERTDPREKSRLYYNAYRGESMVAHSQRSEGISLIRETLSQLRPEDRGLEVHLKALLLREGSLSTSEYVEIAESIYQEAPAAIRNYGSTLPIRYSGDPKLRELLQSSAFQITDDPAVSSEVTGTVTSGTYQLAFDSTLRPEKGTPVSAESPEKAVNAFTDYVFSVSLK